tara:strand:+ start:792 stop:1265 length:474 start_codon:yes stop_codon:yes gene_type:complete
VVPFFQGQYAATKNPKKDGQKINIKIGHQWHLKQWADSPIDPQFVTFEVTRWGGPVVDRTIHVSERTIEAGGSAEHVYSLSADEARTIWEKFINKGFVVIDELPENIREEFDTEPKEYLSTSSKTIRGERKRRRKQRMKSAMTDFDKLKKTNYALEA